MEGSELSIYGLYALNFRTLWQQSVVGTPVFMLVSKLKALPEPLERLNKRKFRHVCIRAAEALQQLCKVQLAIPNDPMNADLYIEDKESIE